MIHHLLRSSKLFSQPVARLRIARSRINLMSGVKQRALSHRDNVMNNKSLFNSLLVPTDFSDASRAAFEWALRLVDGDEPVIIVLHVLDEGLVELIAAHEFADRDDVERRMRKRAEEQLKEYKQFTSADVEVDTIVSVGAPFLEIIRKAEDFALDAIVMSKVGTRGPFEQLLFGSTAEKVLRGSLRPVIALPVQPGQQTAVE